MINHNNLPTTRKYVSRSSIVASQKPRGQMNMHTSSKIVANGYPIIAHAFRVVHRDRIALWAYFEILGPLTFERNRRHKCAADLRSASGARFKSQQPINCRWTLPLALLPYFLASISKQDRAY